MKYLFSDILHEIEVTKPTGKGFKGITECEKYGMTWGCDIDCPVLQRGECELKDSENKKLYEEYLNEIE